MPAFPSALRPPRTADSSERQCRCSHGAQRGPPAPRREKRGAVSHRSHHEVTDWKSLLQLHHKGIGLDLPNSPCDPGRATCQRDGRREGHSLSWQCRNFPAPSPNGTAAPGFRKAISSDASASLRGSAEPERLVRCLLRRLIHSSWGTGGLAFSSSRGARSLCLRHLLLHLPPVTSECSQSCLGHLMGAQAV